MSPYTLTRTIPQVDEPWDVLVAGGGPAGCAAAAAAAREGARTLLIEATGALGGMGTSGLVQAWPPSSDGERVIYRGLAETVRTACTAGMPHIPTGRTGWVAIDPERLKRIYDKLVTEVGVSTLFLTLLAGVECPDGNHVEAVIVANKSGLSALRAKVYIDATGDADLVAWAGAAFEKGDENGALQAATHCFALSNVDYYAYLHRDNTKKSIAALAASERYPEIPDSHGCNRLVGPGTVGFNAGHLWQVDNTDPTSVSRALMQGRRMAHAFQRGLAEQAPASFANAHLVATGALLGIRETRRVVGDYTLTYEDFAARRSFEDEIGRNCYFIDIHQPPTASACEEGNGAGALHLGPGESHGIPYRCLITRDLDNVLVAGRCIATDRSVQGSTRVMPVCLVTGEAAGCAAALAVAGQQRVRDLDCAMLRDRLREHGVYLP